MTSSQDLEAPELETSHAHAASDSDEDPPKLSEHALAALQEFYAEQLAREQLLEAALQTGNGTGEVPIPEDWVITSSLII